MVAQCCYRARGPLGRLIGLLGTTDLRDNEALLLAPCRSVHTWGMRIPLTVVFLDGEATVLAVHHNVRPWRFVGHRGARMVVEGRAGRWCDLTVGSRLSLPPNDKKVRK